MKDELNTKEKINKKEFKGYLYELLSLRASINSVTWGFTIGSFVAFLPAYGIKTILLVVITTLFKKNFTAAFISNSIFGNPLIGLPLYAFEYKLGLLITGFEVVQLPKSFLLREIVNFGWQLIIPLLIGCLVTAVPLALLAHIIFSAWFKKRRQELEVSA